MTRIVQTGYRGTPKARPPKQRSHEPAHPAGMDQLCDDDLKPTGTFRGGWAHRPEYELMRHLKMGPVTVPAGFIVDGYSLPGRLFSAIWQPKERRWMTASTLHDWAYEAMTFGPGERGREMADTLLRRAMKAGGVPDWKCWTVWAAVRAGGAGGYGVVSPQNAKLVGAHRGDLAGVLIGAGVLA